MSAFPKGFLWGAATASYQVEGFNENCDWAKAAKEGKVPGAGRLADHYHRYEEDFDIAKELGHNAHRFSIEWGRIEPQEGVFDEKEIEHYRAVLKALKKRKIIPMVTLWHFTLPLWFAESGGFERKDSPEIFARYCAHVVEGLGDLCEHYSTINEPNVWAGHGWVYGAWPPFKRARIFNVTFGKDDGSTVRVGAIPRFKHGLLYFKVERNLVRAHIAAYEAIKKVSPEALVSIVKHVRWFTSDDRIVNKFKASIMQYLQSDRYMGKIKNHIDEIGLNYYRHTKFGDNKNYLKTDMDWKVYPSGIYGALKTLKKYNLPIFVSEAGIADADDDLRAQYLKVQVSAVGKAIEDGIDVRGHMYWSLIDNYEWALGINKKFGLVEIDYQTLKRTIRPSAWEYKKVIEQSSAV
jgi:beta-glucosidase